jgi:hypothetical protein
LRNLSQLRCTRIIRHVSNRGTMSVISTNFLKFSEIPKSVPKFLPKFDPNILREIFSAPSDLRGAMLSRAIQNVHSVTAIIQCDWSAGAIVL